MRAEEQLDPDVVARREELSESMGEVDPDRFIFLDESHDQTTMTRTHGRAPRGERVVDHDPARSCHSTKVLAPLPHDGTIAAMVYEGTMNAAVIQAFAEGELRRVLRPRDIVVMENCRPIRIQA